jgi:hypothetical protein
MRHLADQEVARAERVRAAARHTFAYLTAIFTVAQAGTLSAFGANALNGLEQVLLLTTAILAALGILTAGLLALLADRLRDAPEIAPQDITRAVDNAYEHDESVSDALTLVYADRIKAHAEVVNGRRCLLRALNIAAGSTMIVLIAQIIIALIARLT